MEKPVAIPPFHITNESGCHEAEKSSIYIRFKKTFLAGMFILSHIHFFDSFFLGAACVGG